MKKIYFLFLFFILILVACTNDISNIREEYSNTISKPEGKLEIGGIWKNTKVYEFGKGITQSSENSDEMFLSKKVFNFNDTYILNPNISSRYVNYFSYMRPKISDVPEEFMIEKDTTVVYKFSDNISFSQEFVEIDENKIITIYLGKIFLYEKQSDLSDDIIEKKYAEVTSLTNGKGGVKNNNFGLAISFRERNTNISDNISYNYYTYYMKKASDDDKAIILKVNDIIIPNTSGLLTVKNTQVIDGENVNYNLSINPTFLNDETKANILTDSIYRRIDYVNPNYIAFTKFNYSTNSVSESYGIHDINNLSKNEPLSATNIAGNSGNEIYLTSYKENINLISSRDDVNVLEFNPNTSNIGMKRYANGWKFVSAIDQQLNNKTSSRIFRPFDLNFSPVINIGQSDRTTFAWRQIIGRIPGAIDASVSTDRNYILVQSNNSIQMYPVYYNYIGNKPLFTIQNVNNYEIVMIQWINSENINSLYEEYLKLPKLNSYIIYQ